MPVLQTIVQFQPTGSIAYVPQHIAKAFGSGDVSLPVVTTQFGGELTSGSFRAYDAKGGKGHLVWMHAQGGSFFDVWEMDSKAAAQTALTTIYAAVAAGDDLIVIGSDGNEPS